MVLWLCCAEFASAQQIVASTNPDRKGTGSLSVSYQSYYRQVNGSSSNQVQGTAFTLKHFFPKSGLLTLHMEPLVEHGLGLGENYVQWKGLPWKGRHWDFSGGDFRKSTALVDVPFTNLSYPELYLRGAKATARTDRWNYSVFGGVQSLSQGTRVPFRVMAPQSALGLEASGSLPRDVQVGFRVLRLASSPDQIAGQKTFFPLNRQFVRSISLNSQVRIPLMSSLEWFTEAGFSNAEALSSTSVARSPLSYTLGPAWNTARFSLRANYTQQPSSYLPVLGYYMGDRKGPHVEGLLHLGPFNLSGSWLQSRNNLEHNPAAPDFFNQQTSGGFNVRLPLDFSLSGSISKIDLESQSPDLGIRFNKNRQYQMMLSRPLYGHNLHTTIQQLDTQLSGSKQRLRFMEIEDNVSWKRLNVGGAVRWQSTNADSRKDSLFLRASLQVQLRKLNLYGYWEQGQDIANESLFATNLSSTSVVGLSWDSPRKTSLRFEAYRNHLTSEVNPESLFVLNSRGITPEGILHRTNDWSIYARISQEFDWGPMPAFDSYGQIRQEAPLLGTLAGYVKLITMAGARGASHVWVITNTGQSVSTDAEGYFQFLEVPQGTWKVGLDMDRLPADLNPSGQQELSAQVFPDQLTRVELVVIPLQIVEGLLEDAGGNPASEGIVVRLLPQNQLTTTDSAGRFGFYNLPEGDYMVEIVENSLPEKASLVGSSSIPVTVRYGIPSEPLRFHLQTVLSSPKPVRTVVIDQQQITAPPTNNAPTAAKKDRRVIARTTSQSRQKRIEQ